VLYTAARTAKALDFAERMHRTIYQLGIRHDANPDGVLTASFGVTHWDIQDKIRAECVFSETDAALYTAKESGRNRVYLKGADMSQHLKNTIDCWNLAPCCSSPLFTP